MRFQRIVQDSLSFYTRRSVAPKGDCSISYILLFDSGEIRKKATSSFSCIDCCRSTCIATVDVGALEQRAPSALRVGLCLEPLDTAVLFSLRHILGCSQGTSAVKPVLIWRPRDSQRSLFTARTALIVCVHVLYEVRTYSVLFAW